MYEGPVQDLIDELGRLPGIGPKSAQRLAFHILKVEPVDAERLARAITEVKARVHFCRVCWNVAEGDLCRICKDSRRDPSLVCVVEEPRDLVAIERTQAATTSSAGPSARSRASAPTTSASASC
jgi:recombination protein RecR